MTNQEQYELIWEKAKKYDRLVGVLDKIRAEIEEIAKDYDKFADYRRVRGLWIAIEIIDKYKTESKDKE